MGNLERKNRIPFEKLPWGRRWYVVSVHDAAGEVLLSLGKEPTRDRIRGFIVRVKKNYKLWTDFLREAAALREMEMKGIAKKYSGLALSQDQIRNRAFDEIGKRYAEIDRDPERNRSFLDPILFPEELQKKE